VYRQLRASHDQNLVIRAVRRLRCTRFWRDLQFAGLAVGAGAITDVVSCPG